VFCGKCGKPIDPADSFCRNCGASAGEAASPVQANPAFSEIPVKVKSTAQAKLGAVIFALSLFGACPAAALAHYTDWIGAFLLVSMVVGMIVGAVKYFAGS
jgi:zinc-ribbon domain